jgi:hypothetical protein
MEVSGTHRTMQTTKKRFPFLIGTTSYIVPDDILPNVRMLASIIDDVELVLFESPDISNIPTVDAIKELADIGEKQGIGYTIHLPSDKKAGAAAPSERTKFCDAAKTIIDRCRQLSPRAWILHLEGIDKNASADDISKWQERCGIVVDSLCAHLDDPSAISIENLGYPWHWHKKIADTFETSLCCDVGHLWMHYPNSWYEHLLAMLPRTKVIHLHGGADGKDHISLAAGQSGLIKSFFELIFNERFTGVVTLEIFNESDLYGSLEVLENTAGLFLDKPNKKSYEMG